MPNVATSLSFAYEARGRFQVPYLDGSATFRPSSVIGAQVAEGTTGALDTSATPIRYRASGRISDLDFETLGNAFAIGTLQDPRYRGSVAGEFAIAGAGATLEDLDLDIRTHEAQISLFGGVFRDVTFEGRVLHDSLTGAGTTVLDRINPAIALGQAYTGE